MAGMRLFTAGPFHTISPLKRNTIALPTHLKNPPHPSDFQSGSLSQFSQSYPTTPCIPPPEHTLQCVIRYLKVKLFNSKLL